MSWGNYLYLIEKKLSALTLQMPGRRLPTRFDECFSRKKNMKAKWSIVDCLQMMCFLVCVAVTLQVALESHDDPVVALPDRPDTFKEGNMLVPADPYDGWFLNAA